jgi:hypothetical protein
MDYFTYREAHSIILRMLIENGLEPAEDCLSDERSDVDWAQVVFLPTSYFSCLSSQNKFIYDASSTNSSRYFGAPVIYGPFSEVTQEKLNLLLRNGADLKAKSLGSPRQHTLLHAFFSNYQRKPPDGERRVRSLVVLRFLIAKGLDLHAPDTLSRTVTDIATGNNCRGLWIEALVGSGVNKESFMREETSIKSSYRAALVAKNVDPDRAKVLIENMCKHVLRSTEWDLLNAHISRMHEVWLEWQMQNSRHDTVVFAESSTSASWKAPERAGHYECAGEIKLRTSRKYSDD